jgi:hypothetical protein
MQAKLIPCVLLTVLLTALPLAANAQDKAQLPYSVVNSYLELFKSLEHLDLIVPSMMVNSTNPKISPQAVEFKIHASDGWHTFSPDENHVIAFSEQPDWSDSILISNQPKKTLQLVIGFSAKRLASTSITYQELMSFVSQFNEALATLASKQGQPASEVKGLTIQLTEGSGSTIRIQAQKGTQTLKSTATGLVIIKYDDALWQENPPVEFDEIPIGIIPLR